MCGIVGSFHFDRSDPVSSEVLCRLRETLHHRGPDDCGVWIAPDGKVGLAHRRLTIVDLSADGHQPMCNEDGTIWITFNGEIYNHLEHRALLERRGHRFRSHSDTEVILHLFEEFGPNCVESLDGMFAFAIWDQSAGQLLLARDRLGVKPLYYLEHQGMLLFASEIKALLAHPEVPRELDRDALGYYLTLKTVPAPQTMFSGIRKLEPGCTLVRGRNGILTKSRYWDAVSRERRISVCLDDRVVAETVRALLRQSVAKRMMADVPIGVFLSGGLDSSAIVALMAPLSSQPINTFSVSIGDVPECSELEYARQVAAQFATNHHEVVIGYQDVVDYLPQLVCSQDEPLADPVSVPLFYLSKLARAAGVKVVLVGEGSDEQFLGYESRISFLRRYRKTWGPLLALPHGVRKALSAVGNTIHHVTGLAKRMSSILATAAGDGDPFLGSKAFGANELEGVLTGSAMTAIGKATDAVRDTRQPLLSAWPAADIASRMIYVDLKIRIAELLLMRIDKVTMSVGLEAREPFLDYRLVEYLMTVPAKLKLRNWNAKHILKQAMTTLLPPNIIHRPKQAFAAPVDIWLRRGLEEFARSTIFGSRIRELGLFRYEAVELMLREHVSQKRNHDVRLWNLINLSAWYDHMFHC